MSKFENVAQYAAESLRVTSGLLEFFRKCRDVHVQQSKALRIFLFLKVYSRIMLLRILAPFKEQTLRCYHSGTLETCRQGPYQRPGHGHFNVEGCNRLYERNYAVLQRGTTAVAELY